MSNDYIFFDEGLRDRFVSLARDLGLTPGTACDAMGSHVVSLPDDLDDELEDKIESAYEDLMAEQRDLVDAGDDSDARRVMGVNIERPDGTTQVVRVPGDYALRLMEHFTLDEIRELVTAIATEVLVPRDGPLCKR